MNKRPTIMHYLRAGHPCIYYNTAEEGIARKRVVDALEKLERNDTELAVWKSTTGMIRYAAGSWNVKIADGPKDIIRALKFIEESQLPVVGIFYNMRHFLKDPNVAQQIYDSAFVAKTRFSAMIFVGPYLEIPPELNSLITYCDCPLPDKEQLTDQISNMLSVYKDEIVDYPKNKQDEIDLIERAAMASMGLDTLSTENALALSLALSGNVDPEVIQNQKEQEIMKSDALEMISMKESMDNIGGFDVLKDWLLKRKAAFREEARRYGLPWPKGILLLGVPGIGKSACAKAVATVLELPLLRLDFGKIFKQYVGSSEATIRQALKVVEAVSPCCLWLDEIDKSLGGSNRSSETDSGVTSRVIATLLTWRQETTKPVFLVGTINNPESLPAMLYRRGRIDEVWYVDLPTAEERSEIFNIHLRKRNRDAEVFDVSLLATVTKEFTGAEIEACIEDAMFSAFFVNEEVNTGHIMKAVADTIPQSTRDAEELNKLKEWAATRARRVSSSTDDAKEINSNSRVTKLNRRMRHDQ